MILPDCRYLTVVIRVCNLKMHIIIKTMAIIGHFRNTTLQNERISYLRHLTTQTMVTWVMWHERTIKYLIDGIDKNTVFVVLSNLCSVVFCWNLLWPILTMGFLPDTRNLGLCMRQECQEHFHRHRLQRKPLVNDLSVYHGTCVTHAPWCMSGSLTRVGEIFYVSGKKPIYLQHVLHGAMTTTTIRLSQCQLCNADKCGDISLNHPPIYIYIYVTTEKIKHNIIACLYWDKPYSMQSN